MNNYTFEDIDQLDPMYLYLCLGNDLTPREDTTTYYEFIFEIPFSDLPKFIHTKRFRHILEWRLKIGK